MVGPSGADQFGLTVGDFDREVDAPIDEFTEAFEVGQEGLDVGEFLGADVPGAAAHVVGIAELPKAPGLRHGVSVLLAERAWTHGPELGELGFGVCQLSLPLEELWVVHTRRCFPTRARESSRSTKTIF